MSQPSELPTWATDDNYADTGVPGVDGTPTKTEPTSGRKAQGWVPSLKQGAQGQNWLLSVICTWITWLASEVTAPIVRHRFPRPFYLNGMAVANSFSAWAPYGTTFVDPVDSTGYPLGALGVAGDGPGYGQIDLEVPNGYQLSSLTMNLRAQAAGSTTQLAVLGVKNGDSTVEILGQLAVTTPTAATDITMNFGAESDGLSVTVTTGSGNVVYTRTVGSYLTDGFFVGQIVTWSGFVSGGNNQQVTITALTATAMTALIGTAVAEVGPGGGSSVAGVMPVSDGTFELQLFVVQVNTGGNSSAMKDLRTTIVAPT